MLCDPQCMQLSATSTDKHPARCLLLLLLLLLF
jgi:hypothetical protein